MKKTKRFIGLFLTLLVAMLFMGCPSDIVEDDYTSPSYVSQGIRFNANGKSSDQTYGGTYFQDLDEGVTAKLIKCEIINRYDTFIGWATSSTGSVEYADEAEITATSGELELYAVWEPYSFKFNKNSTSATGSMETLNMDLPVDTTVSGIYETTLTTNTFTHPTLVFSCWNTKADGTGDVYTANEVVEISALDIKSSIDLYAVWGEYSLGGRGPSNGYIFYDKCYTSDGWRYLEASENDDSTSLIVWEETPTGFEIFDTISGATNTTLGAGKQNTIDILNVRNTAEFEAAYLADNHSVTYNSTTFTDWYLPSTEELQAMFYILHKKNIGSFANTSYWSSNTSTTYGESNSVKFGSFSSISYSPSIVSTPRDSWDNVRAIRKF